MRPRRPLDPWLMLLPTLALLVVFFFVPLVLAGRDSLYEWDLLTPPRYVGLDNYRALVESGELWKIFVTTLSFSVVVVVGSMSLGLGLALALNRPTRFAGFVRGAIFSAYVVSWVSVALLWLWVLDADAGAFTAMLRSLGLPTTNWLGNPIDFLQLAGRMLRRLFEH